MIFKNVYITYIIIGDNNIKENKNKTTLTMATYRNISYNLWGYRKSCIQLLQQHHNLINKEFREDYFRNYWIE